MKSNTAGGQPNINHKKKKKKKKKKNQINE